MFLIKLDWILKILNITKMVLKLETLLLCNSQWTGLFYRLNKTCWKFQLAWKEQPKFFQPDWISVKKCSLYRKIWFFKFNPRVNILCSIRRIGRFHFSIDLFYHPPNRKVKNWFFKDHPQIPPSKKKWTIKKI